MATTGIWFEQVSKKFHRGELHDSLRDLIPAVARRIMGKRRPADQLQEGDFWAVRNVSFTVMPGETLGIIGGNGAGKSTVLKMLTQILRPTLGWAKVEGRIGALIEISAGFHPDLTGRENVFLQGSIRGMPSSKLRQQFDSIVSFSGIEDFIDTPVKRYSSGMNARLGFAIAAHLDPEVLIIDEVLSVGDFGFQTKAFNRIKELAGSGIPVAIVSHQMDRIATLCTKAILLDHGEVMFEGEPTAAIAQYTQGLRRNRPEDGQTPIVVRRIQALNDVPVLSGREIALTLSGAVIRTAQDSDSVSVFVSVRSAQTGNVVFSTTTARLGVVLPQEGEFQLDISLQMNVPSGVYMVESGVLDDRRADVVSQGPTMSVQVDPGPGFTGSVQLNPQISVASLPAV